MLRSLPFLYLGASLTSATAITVTPFAINLTSEIPHLKTLLAHSRLPAQALYPDAGPDKGVELDFLAGLRDEWLNGFDWEVQQAQLNQSVLSS
jgi:hypothetical protein